MADTDFSSLFRLDRQVAVVTGGGGVLCGRMARALAEAGAAVAVLDLRAECAEAVASEIRDTGGRAVAGECNALERASLEAARERVESELGTPSILVCGVGGNHPGATTSVDKEWFDLPEEAVRRVFDVNFVSSFLTCQVFARPKAAVGRGSILMISSMNAFRPLTRIPAYSAAKSAVSNFTMWLSTHLAQEHGPGLRVNAIAPGFFLTLQNSFLLRDEESGDWTPRGRTILDHTPAGRFGTPDDLVGATLWLAGPASEFVTGTVIPVDGGFSAFSGV